MAEIIKPPYFTDVVNAGEQRLLDYLEANLPDGYYLIPNVEIASTNPRNNRTQYWEYDLVLVAPHGLYHIENKDWRGQIEGDDNYWYLNDRQRPNPHKTARQKTAILASKLKEHKYTFGRAWVSTLITLSFRNSYNPIISAEAQKLTFTLNESLIDFITDPSNIGKREGDIIEFYDDIVQFLIGSQSKKSAKEKRYILNYEIVEVLQQEANFAEYLAKPREVTSSIRKSIKEYSLQVSGLSIQELKQHEEKIKNSYHALNRIKTNPFILNVEFQVDEENHLFYEITDYLDDSSLRSEARRKTFTFQDKLRIIRNIMSALKVAHNENIFHRDINPENIYIYDGYATLGNFSKAYFIDRNEEGYTVMSTINESKATAYHPLELTAGDASRKSDIYSLGVLIYWLFTGSEPFKSPFELDRIGGRIPADILPSKINPSLPNWIDDLCNKTVLTDETLRIDSIEELDDFIKKSLEEETTSKIQTNTIPSTAIVDSFDLKEGDRFSDYVIHSVLGKGGYSKVFKVKHSLQGEVFALKLFHESVNIKSVTDEYTALKGLSHKNIMKFVWNGTAPTGQFYTLTEFLDGENLSEYTHTDVRMPIHRIYQVAHNILSALAYMQNQTKPILHRDVKPQNIIWDNNERFVLIDFNVSSFVDDNKDFVGTNPYLAPDLITDNNNVNWDKSADVFSLGITLYELVCKQYPWHPSRMPMTSKPPIKPKEVNKNLSEEFSEFIYRAISTDGNIRFSSAQEMLDELEKLGEDNLLEENNGDSTEATNTDKLYLTQIYISQTGFKLTLFNDMLSFVNVNQSIKSSLEKFKNQIRIYKKSLKLSDNIKLTINVDNEVIVQEYFWRGGAKSFTDGNIQKVYESLEESFESNKQKITEFKIDTEGLDIVQYINSLYSQSKNGNTGTRANFDISEYDKLTYSDSKLDKILIPDILDNKYKLLIITGNAGDGKTAFIRKIEDHNSIININRFGHRNGAEFEISDVKYQSNYDGSQDEDTKTNTDVLDEFFNPFEDVVNYSEAKEGRIIAINEGRLVEFLSTSEKHGKLADVIENYFYKEGHSQLPPGVMIINLNLRSVVASKEEEESLLKKQLKVLTQKGLWNKCNTCPVSDKCFIKYNVVSLNDSAVGDAVINRLEWLIRTVSLKRELHITMRDLRSFISFLLTRDYACEDIEELYGNNVDTPEKYWNNYYFNITNANSDDGGGQDRLIKLLRETDIGDVSIPDQDRNLFFGLHEAKDYIEFADRKISLLDIFNKNKEVIPAHEHNAETISKVQEIQRIYIRHQYFEGKKKMLKINGNSVEMPSYLRRLPYHSIFKFHDILNNGEKSDKQDIISNTKQSISRAISLNEGADNKKMDSKHLVLSSTEVKDPYGKSFRLFDLNDFELYINRTDHLVKYLEYEPDSLIFRHKKDTHIKLTISLDLYEMLYFIQQGFSPSLNDIKGKFVELMIFKNLLENLAYNKVVVTNDNLKFYEISKDNDNKLHVSSLDL